MRSWTGKAQRESIVTYLYIFSPTSILRCLLAPRVFHPSLTRVPTSSESREIQSSVFQHSQRRFLLANLQSSCRMPLPTRIKRGLSLGKSGDKRVVDPRSKPLAQPSQSSASALHRAIHKSTFLYGHAPPTTGTKLTPEQVRNLLDMLSLPSSTPMLTTNIARLPSPLSRHAKSSFSACLCDIHGWFDIRWIEELMDVIGAEIGPHLNHLRNAPKWLTTMETKKILDMLDPYTHIFPAQDPDGPRMASPYQCTDTTCGIEACKLTCKACKLSIFFQDTEAVKALNVCAKGRKRGGKPWPVSCSWLDPLPPRPGWAATWKKEGLPILSDRIIARRWRKSGRQERMTEGMKSVQAEVLADRDSVASVLDQMTRQSVQSALVDSDSVYNEITGRKWSVHEEAKQSSATINLLKRLGLDNDDGEEQVFQGGCVPCVKSYETLATNQPQSARGSIHHVDGDEDHDVGEKVGRGRRSTLLVESPRTTNGGTASHDHKTASGSSRDSVSSWNSRSSHSSRAASPSHSSPYVEAGKDDGRTESRDSWANFSNSPLAKGRSPGSQTQSMASKTKVNVIEQSEHNLRCSAAPAIPPRSPARLSARARGLASAHEKHETRQEWVLA